MIFFLDESGNLGFNFQTSGVTRYFVLTILCCDDNATARSIRHAVKKTINNKVNKRSRKYFVSELKGSYTPLNIKQYFYKKISAVNGWEINALIIDKKKFTLPRYITHNKVYDFLTGLLLDKVLASKKLSSFTLVADRCKTPAEIAEFNRHIASIVYPFMENNALFEIYHENSEQDKALQASDMFCNGIFKKYESEED